jgi:hypothetical protein
MGAHKLLISEKYFIVLSLFLSSFTFGQSIRLITPDDIPGIEVTRYDTFAGKDLTRYLGIRANLCFEYGFKQMCVCEYLLKDDRARMEIYIMEDPQSAYGIYSLSVSGCIRWNLYSTFSCSNPNQVSASSGPFFINVVNLSKTNSGLELCDQIVQKVIDKNPQDSWHIPPIFQLPQMSPYINTLKYTEGPYGVNMGAPQLSGLLENIRFNCFSVSIMAPTYGGILARIVFPDFSALNSFLIQAGLNTSGSTTPTMAMNGNYRSWYKIDDDRLIYLECTSPDLKLSDLIPEKPGSIW